MLSKNLNKSFPNDLVYSIIPLDVSAIRDLIHLLACDIFLVVMSNVLHC